jgi:CheY-like chemotaxis protein
LTELQGGEIGVSSERGVGSTFAFYVKARTLDHVPGEGTIGNAVNSLRRNSSNSSVTYESRRISSGKSIHRSNTTGTRRSPSTLIPFPTPLLPLNASRLHHSGLKILIVEDNLVNQRVLQKQLINLGFTTEVANHGGEALEVLKASKFWTGQEKDGLDLAVILLDLEMPVIDGTIVRHVPIIAVTANARLEQIETAMAAGMVSPSLTISI